MLARLNTERRENDGLKQEKVPSQISRDDNALSRDFIQTRVFDVGIEC